MKIKLLPSDEGLSFRIAFPQQETLLSNYFIFTKFVYVEIKS